MGMKSFISWIFAILCIGVVLAGAVWAVVLYVAAEDTVGVAHKAFDLINQERAELEFPALVWDNDLEVKAIAYSQTMNDTGHFEHSSMGYAECILESTDSFSNGEQVYHPWERSFKHFEILMSTDLHYAAIGIYDGYATFLGR